MWRWFSNSKSVKISDKHKLSEVRDTIKDILKRDDNNNDIGYNGITLERFLPDFTSLLLTIHL